MALFARHVARWNAALAKVGGRMIHVNGAVATQRLRMHTFSESSRREEPFYGRNVEQKKQAFIQ